MSEQKPIDSELEHRLIDFAVWVIGEARDYLGDVDGGDIQNKLLDLDIMESVEVEESCGEGCQCIEYGAFPMECIRLKPAFQDFMELAKKKGGKVNP